MSAVTDGGVSPSGDAPERRWVAYFSAVLVGVLLGWALVRAVWTVDACQVSREWDVLRDVSIAQALFDGRYPEDPILAGEISWYNPLTGVIIAGCAYVSGQPLHRVSVVIGPYVNLLSPMAFYALVAALFGRAAALAGLCLVLYGKEHTLPFWSLAYSPWLLAPMYSLGLMFLTLLGFMDAQRTRSPLRFYLTGLLLGVTFMSHTAPAIVAGATMALWMLSGCLSARVGWRPSAEQRQLVALFLLLLVVAFFASLPYSGPILWRYQFRVLNPWPSLYASQNVELGALPAQLRAAISPRNALALLGLIFVWRRRATPEGRLLLCWGVVVVVFMVQHYVWQWMRLRGMVYSSIVPGHHGAIHLSAVRTALFGMGVAGTGAIVGRVLFTSWPRRARAAAVWSAWTGVFIAAGLLYTLNPFSGRIDFTPPGAEGYFELNERFLPMYEWIRDNTPPEARFICEEEHLGMQIVMPAARKLVCPMLLYSNPYVDRGPLMNRQVGLFDAMAREDSQTFCELAEGLSPLYVLLQEPVDVPPPFAFSVYSEGGVVLYRTMDCVVVDSEGEPGDISGL